MQLGVVFDTSFKDQNYNDTEGNETSFKHKVEQMQKHQYNGKNTQVQLKNFEKKERKADFKCIFHFQYAKIQYVRHMIAIIIAGFSQLLKAKSQTLERWGS